MPKRLLVSLPLVIIVGAIVRLATIVFIDFSTFNWAKPRPDLLMEYGVIARNLSKGLGYSYTWYTSASSPITLPSAYMPPGMVFLEYAVIAVFGYTVTAAVVIFLVQVAMGAACIWLAGNITAKLFNDEHITAAARWIMAIYPPFIYMTMSFGITSLLLVTSLAVIYCALLVVEEVQTGKTNLRAALFLGVSSGILMLSRGEGPLVIFMAFLVLAIRLRHQLQVVFKPLAIAAIVAIACIAPWTIRNYVVFDRFIPVSSNGSLNFWRGNNALSNGSPLTENGDPIWSSDSLWLKSEPALAKGVDFEHTAAALYQEAAFDWIKSNPADAALLALKKALIFWTYDFHNKLSGWMYSILHTLLLGLTIFGAVRLIRVRKRFTLLASSGLLLVTAWSLLSMIIAMIFLPLIRFQLVTMGVLTPIAAYGAAQLYALTTRDRK